ncbi:E3 SUMO-protein ligase NSE2 [Sorochytrium milnesiophthora]
MKVQPPRSKDPHVLDTLRGELSSLKDNAKVYHQPTNSRLLFKTSKTTALASVTDAQQQQQSSTSTATAAATEASAGKTSMSLLRDGPRYGGAGDMEEVSTVVPKLRTLRADVQRLGDQALVKFKSSLSTAATECEELAMDDQVAQLHDTLKLFGVLMERLQNDAKVLQGLEHQLASADDAQQMEDTVLEDLKAGHDAFVPSGKQHDIYGDFLESVHAVRNNPTYMPSRTPATGSGDGTAHDATAAPGNAQTDDNDFEIVSDTQLMVCPLTAQPLREPMRSKRCRHHYERAAILDHIRQHVRNRERAECPVAGCNYFVDEADLERNVVLEQRLRRLRESQELDNDRGQGDYVMVG